MNFKTRGIVFHHIKYNDTSLIASIYTQSSGRKSFLIKGVYKPKSQIKAGFFQPLSLLELEISLSGKRELQRIKNITPFPPLNSLYTNIQKQTIVFFIAEVVHKTIREEETNPALFEFLFNSILYLDTSDNDYSNFHLIFLLQLTRFLGFFPQDDYSGINNIFDALNGNFVSKNETGVHLYSERLSSKLHTLLNLNFESSSQLNLNRTERLELLELILNFYGLHLHSHLNIQSLSILKEIFD